ncbi:MAG: histidine phosphatase family protein [bacterium]|nr:histidine phosphatase family protein [bacterium]
MRLILVRHGQTGSNVTRALDTAEPGADLTDLGREQAEALVERFGEERVDLLVTSQLVRTRQTAAPLAKALGLTPREDPRIREIVAGDLEMLNDDDSVAAYVTAIAAWMEGALDVRMPGAESGHEVIARYDAAVEEARSEVGDGAAMFVSHGAVIRTWAAVRGANVPPGWGIRNVLHNTDAVVLQERGGEWMVESWQGLTLDGER